MRIARVVLIVLLMVGSVSVVFAAKQLWQAHRNVVEDQQLAGLAQARSDWYEGTVALSFERSVTQVALALETAAPSAFLDLIAQQRAQSDAMLARTRAILTDMAEVDARATFLEETAQTQSRIADLRREADAMLASTAGARDAARARALPYDLKSSIEELYASAARLVLPEGQASTEEMMLNRIQALAWEIREYGGRARTFYAIASLTGAPIPALHVGEAVIDTQRARAGWRQLLVAAEAGDVSATLAAAIAEVEAPFAIRYMSALEEMDAAMATLGSDQPAALPYSFEAFFELSNAGLDAVAGLAPIAGDHIQAYWAAQIEGSKRARAVSAVIMASIAALVIVSVLAMQRLLIRPLTAATTVLQDMAGGQLDRDFRQTPRGLDEIRVIWEALEALTRKLRSAHDEAERERDAERRAKEGIMGEMMQALKRLSDGDLTYEITEDYGDTYRQLTQNFNRTCETLRGLVTEVVEDAVDMSRRSQTLGASVEDLSRRTETQTALVAETATRLQELARILDETGDTSARSTRTVEAAATKAEAGRAVVGDTTTSMDQIRRTSEEINGISTMIDGIAFQTSLLSLNAGVEAARAGEAGKGFAVVAQEIRTLADQASDAARQVKDLVAASEDSVTSGVENVEKAGQSLHEIMEMVKAVTGDISAMDAASRVQASKLSEIGRTMQDLDAMARQNASMAEEARDTSAALRAKSTQLQSVVGRFSVTPNGLAGSAPPERSAPALKAG